MGLYDSAAPDYCWHCEEEMIRINRTTGPKGGVSSTLACFHCGCGTDHLCTIEDMLDISEEEEGK